MFALSKGRERNCIAHTLRLPRTDSPRLLCMVQPGQRAYTPASRPRPKERDTVMTQTSCILVPHAGQNRARGQERARSTHAGVPTITQNRGPRSSRALYLPFYSPTPVNRISSEPMHRSTVTDDLCAGSIKKVDRSEHDKTKGV